MTNETNKTLNARDERARKQAAKAGSALLVTALGTAVEAVCHAGNEPDRATLIAWLDTRLSKPSRVSPDLDPVHAGFAAAKRFLVQTGESA